LSTSSQGDGCKSCTSPNCCQHSGSIAKNFVAHTSRWPVLTSLYNCGYQLGFAFQWQLP
jgi:hypothetical protein